MFTPKVSALKSKCWHISLKRKVHIPWWWVTFGSVCHYAKLSLFYWKTLKIIWWRANVQMETSFHHNDVWLGKQVRNMHLNMRYLIGHLLFNVFNIVQECVLKRVVFNWTVKILKCAVNFISNLSSKYTDWSVNILTDK